MLHASANELLALHAAPRGPKHYYYDEVLVLEQLIHCKEVIWREQDENQKNCTPIAESNSWSWTTNN